MERKFSRGPKASWQDVTPGKLDEKGKESRSHFKTHFLVILNEVKDLKALKMRDSSLRSE
jgi:hypothetical protein